MAPIHLRHLHLPASPADGIYPSYKTAAAIQELLRRRLLDFKDAEPSPANPHTLPLPTLISFSPQPTYTLGRRQRQKTREAPLSTAAIARLKAPLRIHSNGPTPLPTLGCVPQDGGGPDSNTRPQHQSWRALHPVLFTSPRGGLATYHGPGQVVLWPVMAIQSSRPHGYKHFTVRCYARLLEATTIALLRRLFGLAGFTTDELPGVWVHSPTQPEDIRKISALGIYLRRHVSGMGTAVNLDMPTTRGGVQAEEGEEFNPWARFTACGLEGKGVTCVKEELRLAGARELPGLDGEGVAKAWAAELAERMDLDPAAVEFVGQNEVAELKAIAQREGYMDLVGKEEI